jgi:phage shock protein C
MNVRLLTRSRTRGKIAGVCAGIADYLDVDVVLVRAAWLVLSIVPGAIVGGVLAYAAAWLLIPEDSGAAAPLVERRLTRSLSDKQIAGVCGGLAEYFRIDSTVVRLVWCILSIFCGAIIGGVFAYLVAWFIIPKPQTVALPTPAPASAA